MRTPSEMEKVAAGGTATTLDTAHVADFNVSETDQLNVVDVEECRYTPTTVTLCTTRKRGGQVTIKTKAFGLKDGRLTSLDTPRPYLYNVELKHLTTLEEFSNLRQELEGDPTKLFVLGAYVGDEKATFEKGGVRLTAGRGQDSPTNFVDREVAFVTFDIDRFRSAIDPVAYPVTAINEWVAATLPEAFHGRSFDWALSSSAGLVYWGIDKETGKFKEKDNRGILKAHVTFQLDTPYMNTVLEAWAVRINREKGRELIDATVFRTVQPHFIAGPYFEDPDLDPLKGMPRSGYVPGDVSDTVPLVIDAIEIPLERGERGKESYAEKDQKKKAKPGVVGAFFRAFTNEDVVTDGDLLGDWFYMTNDHEHFDLKGATPGACFLRGDCFIGCDNDTWSFYFDSVVVDTWEAMRVLRFGHLDQAKAAEEDFETMSEFQPGSRPSDLAMKAYVETLQEVKAILEAEALGQINAQSDFAEEESATADDQEADENLSECSKSLKMLTMTQLMAMPQPKWLVKNLLARDSLALIYGQSSVGKTFAVIDIALAVARGTGEWFGRKAKAGGVFYIAGEGARGLVNRMKAYCQHHEVNPEEVNASFYAGALNLLDENAAEIAKETVRQLKPSLVIIDTLATTMIGGDESSAKDMTSYLASAKMLRRACKACVLIVHHSGKDESRGARGSSSLRAAVDTEIAITQTGDVRSMKITKQRDGIAGVEIGYQLQSIELGLDEDLESITSCVVIPADLPVLPAKPLGTVQSLIMDAIGLDMTITKERLFDVVIPLLPVTQGKADRRRERVSQALKSLESSGHIEINAEGGITTSF